MAKCSALYTIGGMAKRQAEAEGRQDALMLDWRGLVAETTSANLFFIMNGKLLTPTPDGFLDGITRPFVIALARRAQIKVVERRIEAHEIAGASEVFVAGTAAEVTPVRRIGGLSFKPCVISERLVNDFTALTRETPERVAGLVG